MTATKDPQPILAETSFAGEISTNGKGAPIAFRIKAEADCRLVLWADSVGKDAFLLAVGSQGSPGTSIDEFILTGKSADGKTIASESGYAGAYGIKNDSRWIRLGTRAAKVTLPLERPVQKPCLRLWFRSFKTFRNPVIETALGRLAVQGEAQTVSADDMSGSVTLQATSGHPPPDWYERANDFLTHMHRGLALAHGGRLQTPRLDYLHESIWEVTFFEGMGFKPELPVQHHLNQGPFIEALADRFEREGPLPDILWTALSWMQTDTTIDETRFLTAMTALEAIIESELPERRGTIIPKKDFRPLRLKINNLIEAEDTLSQEAGEILAHKISQLNTKTFSQKISALFDHYAIPRRDFEEKIIGNLVELRNSIVHRGQVPNEWDIWPNIILVRELITRILLKEIGFSGRYCCYVGGLNDRDFPGNH
jgi:hypothetical protein